eukprot:CAMPEP_0176016200 /NCGR_PEP_ID=MMETSP0120_2-20121206/7727_1 /TAXON_ID=160619 /ORGANISM="Kryptoperidinium foliaceum, Strain CCMP 1326" /LENGTH=49 /DNA_ID= /DNA_START= /DNA_END= /DNA_ORIENTATION=
MACGPLLHGEASGAAVAPRPSLNDGADEWRLMADMGGEAPGLAPGIASF